jgi:hypothetical protein
MAAGGMAFELGIAVTAVIAVMEMYSGNGVLVSCLSCGFAAGALCQKMGCGSRAAFLALCGLGGVIALHDHAVERDDADFICLLSQLYLVRCAVKDRIEFGALIFALTATGVVGAVAASCESTLIAGSGYAFVSAAVAARGADPVTATGLAVLVPAVATAVAAGRGLALAHWLSAVLFAVMATRR